MQGINKKCQSSENMTEKLINNSELLERELKIKIPESNKIHLNNFLKKKTIRINNNKIIFPKYEDVKYNLEKQIIDAKELKHNLSFWKNEKAVAERYHKLLPLTMILKKNYWRHSIKKITDKQYKKDIEETKLTTKILLDPEYRNLFETFIIDPDYRKKLKETVNTSIIYKNNKIGDYSIKKQEFKQSNAKIKIKTITEQINDLDNKIQENKVILECLKKYS